MSEHVTRIEFAINSFHSVVPVPQLVLQPAVLDLQMLHSSHSFRVTECLRDIRMCVQDDWQKTHPAEMKIEWRHFWLLSTTRSNSPIRFLRC